MKILGIDTSSGKNFAIGIYDKERFVELNFSNFDNTDGFITFALKSLAKIINIDLQEVDYFAVGIGPGSFTGLRIGITIVKTMAWAIRRKIVPISSLDLIVHSLEDGYIDETNIIVPTIDARTGKLFSAIFDSKKNRLTEYLDIEPNELNKTIKNHAAKHHKITFIGEGFLRYKDVFKNLNSNIIPEITIRGKAICKEALKIISSTKEKLVSPEELEPNYLRKSEAELNLQR